LDVVAQPAISVAQRQSSILTPVGSEDAAEEAQSEGVTPSPTVLATDEEKNATEEITPISSETPSFTPTLPPTSTSASPTAASTNTPERATEVPQPTNTRVLPTATKTATRAVSPPATPTATTGTGGSTSCSPGGNSAFESEVINLINQKRAAEGLPGYSNQSQLTSAARTHSDDMACNNFFSHTSPTTGSPFDRITAAGYGYSAAGENIAAGYGSPSALVEGWMSSAGHRANILSEGFTQIGIGYAYWGESDYGAYWTAVFASP
jgi:uncharacterized protein YkwD